MWKKNQISGDYNQQQNQLDHFPDFKMPRHVCNCHPSLSYLHVSLQLQQVEPVPGDKAGPLVWEVHSPETGLPRTQERLANREVVGPHEVVVDGDVLELHGVPVRAEDLRVAPRGDHQVRVHRALGLVQRVQERTLLVRAELHHVSPYWGIIAEEKWINSFRHALIGGSAFNDWLKTENDRSRHI